MTDKKNKQIEENIKRRDGNILSFLPFSISAVCYYKSLYYFYSIKNLTDEKIYGHSGFGLTVIIYFSVIFSIGFTISIITSVILKSRILFFLFCFAPLLILLILRLYKAA